MRPWRIRQLVRYGQPTQGIIRDVQMHEAKGTISYRMTYEYAVPASDGADGQVFTRKMSSTRKDASQARKGDLATVLYHPSKPWRSLVYRYCDYMVK